MIYVVAENYGQAEQWAWNRGKRRPDWRYISDSDQLRGLIPKETEVVKTGRWGMRDDIVEIEDLLDRLEFDGAIVKEELVIP